jgi:hypothetical protein
VGENELRPSGIPSREIAPDPAADALFGQPLRSGSRLRCQVSVIVDGVVGPSEEGPDLPGKWSLGATAAEHERMIEQLVCVDRGQPTEAPFAETDEVAGAVTHGRLPLASKDGWEEFGGICGDRGLLRLSLGHLMSFPAEPVL